MMALRLRTNHRTVINPPLAHRFSTSSKFAAVVAAVAQTRKALAKCRIRSMSPDEHAEIERNFLDLREELRKEEEEKFQYGSNSSSYVSETQRRPNSVARLRTIFSEPRSSPPPPKDKDKLKMEHDKGRDEFEMSQSDFVSSKLQGEVAPPPGTEKLPKVYNPQISCSICRKKGHNKRTCPLRHQQGGNVQQEPVNVQEEGDNVRQQEPLNV